jgi:hypothetical protein
METLKRIHESCNSQTHLECADIFTQGPTRHILQAIRRSWRVDRVHGLPVVSAPTFFPSASKNNETWWGPQGTKTVYLWDVMDDQDRHNSMVTLKATREWTIWKTKDKGWSPALQKADFHQLLNIHKDKHTECWGFKIKPGMVAKRGYSYHESQEVLRILGENHLGHTNGISGGAYGGSTCATTQCRER